MARSAERFCLIVDEAPDRGMLVAMKRSWSAREWLPSAATLTLIGVTTTAASVVVEADGPPSAPCPACDRLSQTRHSRDWRTLKDLAAHGRSVTLRVHVSRWRCGNSQCDTVLFADRLADSHRVGGEFPIATQETFNEPQRGISQDQSKERLPRWFYSGAWNTAVPTRTTT